MHNKKLLIQTYNDLSQPFVDSFKSKFSKKFGNELITGQKIFYHVYRQFCGLSLGLTKQQSNEVLNILKGADVVELNSDGFFIRNKKFFECDQRWS